MATAIETQGTKIGRPSSYCPEVAADICLRMAEGESLRSICRDDTMPARQTVYRWLQAEPLFRDQYRHARELLVEHWAEEIIEISDDTALDTVTKVTPQGREYEAVDHENIQRSKLRVNTRQWLMARLAPKKYGDRVEHEHSGQVAHDHQHSMSDKEIVRRLALFLVESPGAGSLIEGEAIESHGTSIESDESSTPVDPEA